MFSCLTLLSCSSGNILTKNIWGLDKYIYPLTTVYLKGYLYEYRKENKFLTLFSPTLIDINENKFLKILSTGNTALYYEPYYFNYSTPKPDLNINYQNSSLKDSLLVKSIITDANFTIKQVEGEFIVGVTNTFKLNDILSHHYRFNKNIKVMVICPK